MNLVESNFNLRFNRPRLPCKMAYRVTTLVKRAGRSQISSRNKTPTHLAVYCVKDLYVCLFQTLASIISGLASQNKLKFVGNLCCRSATYFQLILHQHKTISNKFCMFECQTCFFVRPFLQFLPQKLSNVYIQSVLNNYLDLHHSQGCMKFVT